MIPIVIPGAYLRRVRTTARVYIDDVTLYDGPHEEATLYMKMCIEISRAYVESNPTVTIRLPCIEYRHEPEPC